MKKAFKRRVPFRQGINWLVCRIWPRATFYGAVLESERLQYYRMFGNKLQWYCHHREFEQDEEDINIVKEIEFNDDGEDLMTFDIPEQRRD